MKITSEKDIENLLAVHPHLILPEFANADITQQFELKLRSGETRYIDMVVQWKNVFYIIELKKDKIISANIGQIREYISRMVELYPEKIIVGMLIGKEIDPFLLEMVLKLKQVKVCR